MVLASTEKILSPVKILVLTALSLGVVKCRGLEMVDCMNMFTKQNKIRVKTNEKRSYRGTVFPSVLLTH